MTLLVLAVVLCGTRSFAAGRIYAPDHPLALEMSDRQRLVLETIAMQPEDLHPAILEVVLHEEVLILIPTLWSDFEIAIAPVLEPYDDSERAAVQHLARYPGLMDELVRVGNGDETLLEGAVSSYPETVRALAQVAGRDHQPLLLVLTTQSRASTLAFESLIADRSPRAQSAFREVISRPELTALMVENLDVAQLLAGASRIDRVGTATALQDLHRVVEQREREEAMEAERRRVAVERAMKERAARKQQRRDDHARRRLYWGGYPYWRGNACWYGDPYNHGYYGHGRGRCSYPWYGYRRRWW
jgi:hypothetical protein